MAQEKIVAAALLTEHDLRILGEGFDRYFPVPDTLDFQDLLDAIDVAEAAAARRRSG